MAKRIYNQTALFGELYAYLIVLSPPKEVNARLFELKQQMNAIAGIGERNLKSIGHITLTDRLTDEADFENTVSNLIKEKKSFPIEISGIGVFDHSPDKKTVFLNVRPHEPILALMQQLNVKSGFPHLPLAKNISAQTLDALTPFISGVDFSASWTCEEVLVLKKPMPLKHLGFRPGLRIKLI